jgi:hypothetical protein
MRLSLNLERLVLIAAAGAVLALACQPAVEVDAVVTARSCTDNAQTMIFELNSSSAMHNFYYLGGSANVLGIPFVYPNNQNPTDWSVVTDLNNVAHNDKVTVKFQTHVDINVQPVTLSLAGISFFKAPSSPLPTVPDCAPAQSPTFTITYIQPPPGSQLKAPASLTLEVSDPNPLPMSLVLLDLVHVPEMLDASVLDWDNADFNALPWQSAIPGGAILDPASPPVVTPLPDGPAGGAVLCRFVSIYDGNEVSGIVQENLSAPLGTKAATWGEVKALFRG